MPRRQSHHLPTYDGASHTVAARAAAPPPHRGHERESATPTKCGGHRPGMAEQDAYATQAASN
nr:unnamed protein product [Digitaria exilis]